MFAPTFFATTSGSSRAPTGLPCGDLPNKLAGHRPPEWRLQLELDQWQRIPAARRPLALEALEPINVQFVQVFLADRPRIGKVMQCAPIWGCTERPQHPSQPRKCLRPFCLRHRMRRRSKAPRVSKKATIAPSMASPIADMMRIIPSIESPRVARFQSTKVDTRSNWLFDGSANRTTEARQFSQPRPGPSSTLLTFDSHL